VSITSPATPEPSWGTIVIASSGGGRTLLAVDGGDFAAFTKIFHWTNPKGRLTSFFFLLRSRGYAHLTTTIPNVRGQEANTWVLILRPPS
jgi:hypothetical protein